MNNLFLEKGNKEQRKILKRAKITLGISWKKLFKLLNVKRSTGFFYLNERIRMPYKVYIKLCHLVGIKLDKSKVKLVKIKNTPNKIFKPTKLSEDLSEFLGIMFGDGSMTKVKNAIEVSCNAQADFEHVTKHIRPLFIKLFKIKPTISFQKNKIRCKVYSKELLNFLSKKFDLPIGEKKNRLKTPEKIKQNKRFACAFIRGLFDTDGGFFRHHKKSAMLELTSYSPALLEEVYMMLKKLDLNPSLSGKNLYICDRKKIDYYFKTVSSNNPRLTKKYEIYKKTGIVPLQREMAFDSR